MWGGADFPVVVRLQEHREGDERRVHRGRAAALEYRVEGDAPRTS